MPESTITDVSDATTEQSVLYSIGHGAITYTIDMFGAGAVLL